MACAIAAGIIVLASLPAGASRLMSMYPATETHPTQEACLVALEAARIREQARQTDGRIWDSASQMHEVRVKLGEIRQRNDGVTGYASELQHVSGKRQPDGGRLFILITFETIERTCAGGVLRTAGSSMLLQALPEN
jgi:hypothetical protein